MFNHSSPVAIATQKPLGRPVDIRADLRGAALSLFTLRDGQPAAIDELGASNLAFLVAQPPIWSASQNGGQGLFFDGNDECWGAIPAISTTFWLAGSITVPPDITTVQTIIGLGAAAVSFGAFALLQVDSGFLRANFRRQDGSGTNTVGTSAFPLAAGQTYHCAYVERSTTEHCLFVNGVKLLNTTSFTGTNTDLVNFSIGCLRRGATSSMLNDGWIHWGAYGKIDPGDAFFRDLTTDPYALIYAPPQYDLAFLKAPAVVVSNQWSFLAFSGGG